MISINFGDERLPQRFWDKCMPEPMSGCWLWFAATTHDGYAAFNLVKQQKRVAHRQAYQILVGNVPEGLVLDHKCRVRCCVNPAHLEPVTNKENGHRGRYGVLTTHCPRGHAYDDANTYVFVSSKGFTHRACRACKGLRAKEST